VNKLNIHSVKTLVVFFPLIISILPLFVSLFWAALLLISKKNIVPNYYLALILSLSVIPFFTRLLYFNRLYALFACMDHLSIFISLSVFPLLYYYVRLLTHDPHVDWRWMWMLLPSFLLALFSFFLSSAMRPEELNMYIHHVVFQEGKFQRPFPMLVQWQVIRMAVCKIVLGIQVVLSLYFGCRHVIQYLHAIKENHPNKEDKEWRRIKWVLWVFCILSFFSLVINAVGEPRFIDKQSSLLIDCFTYALLLSLLGFAGYHQHFSIADLEHFANNNKRKLTRTKPTNEYKPDSISKVQLNELMEKEELFRDPELRMTDIALKIGTNRTYLSRIVNDESGSNFCEWVNGFRIEYAKNTMQNDQNDHLTLRQISEMSGFATFGVFYKVFKAKEGIPPGEYRNSH